MEIRRLHFLMMTDLFLLEIYKLNARDYFENFFKLNKAPSYSKSLKDFFLEIVWPRLPRHSENPLHIIDLGPGNYSLFEDIPDLNANIAAIDFSVNAVASAPQKNICYIEANVTDPINFKVNSSDLIFDSHCLNCITDEAERSQVFRNIYQALSLGSLFACELMVQPIGQNISMPFKKIKTAMELEQEIISHGFKIIYFMISKDSGFSSVVDGLEVKCDVLKIVAQK